MLSANSRSNFVTDNSLYIDYEGTIVDTGLVFDVRKWHTVGISFNEKTVISEFDEIQPVVCPLRATNSNATRLICLCLRSPKKRPLQNAKVLEWRTQTDSNRQPSESESDALSSCAMGAY